MKRLVSSIAAVACVLGSTASIGCGSSSGNPAKSALDSLPNAPLNQTTAQEAASAASSAAAGAQSVPQTSDFTGVGSLPTVPLKAIAASKLPLQQKTALMTALNRVGTQVVTAGCPTVTDNSAGSVVDVTVDAGAGCTLGTGETLVGKMTLKGTADATAGTVSLALTASGFGVTIACSPGSMSLLMNGTGSVSASGLTDASTSFTVNEKVDLNIGISGTCNGQSASGSGFVTLDASLTGSKAGNVWTFTISRVEGTEYSAAGAKIGAYGDYSGTITIDTKGTPLGSDDTGTVALTGRVGWNNPLYSGKIAVAYDASFDHTVCYSEPKSGTLELTSGSNKVVVTFDGSTPTICGCAPWTLNGAAGGQLCW